MPKSEDESVDDESAADDDDDEDDAVSVSVASDMEDGATTMAFSDDDADCDGALIRGALMSPSSATRPSSDRRASSGRHAIK